MGAKIASKLGDMLEVRKTLEADWAWRVAAYTARRGLTDEEIQAVLRGPLAMPDISELVISMRDSPPGEQAKLSESVDRPEETVEMRETGQSEDQKTEEDVTARAGSGAVPVRKEATSRETAEDRPLAQPMHLKPGEGAKDEAETAGNESAQGQRP